MEHFAFPGNIDFAADDQGAFHVILIPGCCVYSSSVKQCLPSVNHEQFPIQMTQNCKHSKCLQILAEEDFPLKLLGRTPIKIYRRADRRTQPRSREHRFSTAIGVRAGRARGAAAHPKFGQLRFFWAARENLGKAIF